MIRWDKATMVRETVRTYTQRLPAPAPSSAPRQEARRPSEEEVAGEIIELKRALNTARSAGGSAEIYPYIDIVDVDIVDNANIADTTCRWRRCGLGGTRAAWAGTGGEEIEVGETN